MFNVFFYLNTLWNDLTMSWNELTISWNEMTLLWNEITFLWNEVTWNDLTMERNDRIPLKHFKAFERLQILLFEILVV